MTTNAVVTSPLFNKPLVKIAIQGAIGTSLIVAALAVLLITSLNAGGGSLLNLSEHTVQKMIDISSKVMLISCSTASLFTIALWWSNRSDENSNSPRTHQHSVPFDASNVRS